MSNTRRIHVAVRILISALDLGRDQIPASTDRKVPH